MIAEGYSMDLYCDVGPHDWTDKGMACFAGPDSSYCNKKAREAGWKISRDRRRCICPTCVKAGKRMPRSD